jgi:hypothetical protein
VTRSTGSSAWMRRILFGFAAGELLRGEGVEAALHFGQIFSGHGEADGEGVAAEAGVEIGAGLDGFEQREAVDRAA